MDWFFELSVAERATVGSAFIAGLIFLYSVIPKPKKPVEDSSTANLSIVALERKLEIHQKARANARTFYDQLSV